jgi:hypothetical protein
MKTLLLSLALLSGTLLSQAAHAQDNFSIETVNGEVCRTKPGQAIRCLPTFKSLGFLGSDQIELVERVQQKSGGSFVLSATQSAEVLSSYRRLSIRNLATNPARAVLKDGQLRMPFFASVYWKGRGFMEGTIHVEGEIVAASESSGIRSSNFADSTTEQKLEALRTLETAARHIHFRIAGTSGKTVDEATMALLNEIVGPVILGEIAVKSISDIVGGQKVLR